MKRVLLCAHFLVVISGLVSASEPAVADKKKQAIETALAEFAGTWEFVAVAPAEVTKDARRLVFRKDGSYAAHDKDGQELWTGTFEVDPTAAPKIWDHRSHESQKKGEDVLGIYELDGDKLKVCCAVGTWKDKQWTGKPRPKEFKLDGADVLLELRRVKAAN